LKTKNNHKIIIIGTFISLIFLILIQFLWIFQSARNERRQFANKVELALLNSKEDIAKSNNFCKKMNNCFAKNEENCKNKMSTNDWNIIDSIIKKNLAEYKIDLDYNFDIVEETDAINNKSNCYIQSLEEVLQTAGVELTIHFPSQNDFILKQISLMFVSSLILIFIISFSFFLMLKFYLNEKNISKNTRDFINNMTHEFKTPLANIGLATNLLKKKVDDNNLKIILKYTDIIASEKTKLTENIEQILTVASLEKSTNMLVFETIEIDKIIDEAIEANNILLKENLGKIYVSNNWTENKINGNKFHLINLFTNIIDNACKYTTAMPEIKISTYNKNNYFVTEIADNGIGISKEHQKFVFDKYFRVPTGDVHNNKGFGLGLSYVKTVTEQHKGKIEIKSILNKGTTFIIYLPNNII